MKLILITRPGQTLPGVGETEAAKHNRIYRIPERTWLIVPQWLWPPDSDLIQMGQQIRGILVYAVRAGALEFFLSVAT